MGICKLWVFADRGQIPALKNRMINESRDKVSKIWQGPTLELNYIYGNTTKDSELRAFAIFIISDFGNATIIDNEFKAERWPKEALVDLLQAVWQKKGGTVASLATVDLSKFHVETTIAASE